MLTMNKPWFITGSSRGFSRIWAEAALKRGDKVTATARKLAHVADLKERFGDAVLPLALDVTDPNSSSRLFSRRTGISAGWTFFSTMPVSA
jgi:NADP-dependent 3-hydroxy acid dehydrogenase YdfG